MDTKHGKRAHKRFLNDELGPENENNLQIGKVTWGHKYLRFCLKSSLEFFISLPLTFPIYLIIYQYPKYHQSTGNMTFRLLTSKIDVLPISQDFPIYYTPQLWHRVWALSSFSPFDDSPCLLFPFRL